MSSSGSGGVENIDGLFFDEKRKALFENGFVHIKNAFPVEAVEEVRRDIDKFFDDFHRVSASHGKVHMSGSADSSDVASVANITEINHLVKLMPALKKSAVAMRCRSISSGLLNKRAYCSFDHAIYKPPGSGEIGWHQDQAYKAKVKEMQSLHFWIPLHDVHLDQGGMRYVAGSHLQGIFEHSRHPHTHTLSVKEGHIHGGSVERFPVEAGDVIIHLPRTLHGSLPNMGSETRKAWILHFGPYGRYEPLLPWNLFFFAKEIVSAKLRKF